MRGGVVGLLQKVLVTSRRARCATCGSLLPSEQPPATNTLEQGHFAPKLQTPVPLHHESCSPIATLVTFLFVYCDINISFDRQNKIASFPLRKRSIRGSKITGIHSAQAQYLETGRY